MVYLKSSSWICGAVVGVGVAPRHAHLAYQPPPSHRRWRRNSVILGRFRLQGLLALLFTTQFLLYYRRILLKSYSIFIWRF